MSSYPYSAISVIVVNFNAGSFLGLCIDRIRNSTTDVELIVVDNHSKDISKVWTLGRDGCQSEKYIQNDENLGFSTAVNIGANAASGEFLVVINPDCLVWPHTIERLCKFLNGQQEVGLVGGLVFGIDGREQSGCRRYELTPIRSLGKMLGKIISFKNMPTIDMTHEPIPQNSIDVDAVSGSFFAVRKSLYNELGGLDEDYFLHFEDLDFCRRVREAGYRVVFNPDVSVVHVGAVSSGVKSVEIIRYKHHSLKIYFRKHLSRYSLTVRVVSMMSQFYVWLRLFYELMKPKNGYDHRSDQFERTWNVTNVNDVFVLGDQCRLLRSIVMRLAARGYNVVVETTDPQRAPNIPQVTWVSSEYRAKVPAKDFPEFIGSICLGSIEQITDFEKRSISQTFGSQLLVETQSETNVVVKSELDWLQRASLCLRLKSCNSNHGEIDYCSNINNIDAIRSLRVEDDAGVDNNQQVHVDDFSELCLDVFVGMNAQGFDVTSQQILKDAVDQFNLRIRPLYN